MKARLLRRMLLALALLGLLTVGAWAADPVSSGTCGRNVTWTLSSDGVLTISGSGMMQDYSAYNRAPWYGSRASIKSVVIVPGVGNIGNCAFSDCTALTNVTIPDGINAIWDYAFSGCTSLSSVDIPQGTMIIGGSAFSGCTALGGVTLPDTVTQIWGSAFENCTSLSAVKLSASLEKIGAGAFSYCSSLTAVTIPGSVTSIGSWAFNCETLATVTFTGSAPDVDESAFVNACAVAYYPSGDATWTEAKRQNYGGRLTWQAKCFGAHTVVTDAAVKPTCTQPGKTEGSHCAACGLVLTEQKEIPALGHSFTNYIYNNDAKEEEDGTETAKCDRCDATDTRTAVGTALPRSYFPDVAHGSYYERAVAWAVYYGITNGTSDTTFSPDAPCNRGQIVTFLWRMAGMPMAHIWDSPFTDVKPGSFCYEAVLWAAEQGITTGKTDSTFCPTETCNRGQIVTFLWRYAGKPTPQNQTRQFTDVAAGSFCDQAVLWAVENGITNGKSAAIFDPVGKCTRAQAVTFLYRGRELLKDRVFD